MAYSVPKGTGIEPVHQHQTDDDVVDDWEENPLFKPEQIIICLPPLEPKIQKKSNKKPLTDYCRSLNMSEKEISSVVDFYDSVGLL